MLFYFKLCIDVCKRWIWFGFVIYVLGSLKLLIEGLIDRV